MAHRIVRPLQRTSKSVLLLEQLQKPKFKPMISNIKILDCCYQTPKRSYISEMRKEAFEGNLLRLLRYEIRYELEQNPPLQPVPEFNSFMIDERPTEQWIRLARRFNEKEEIKIEVTMFDASIPAKKPGGNPTDEDVQLHITMIVDVYKGEGDDVLEFVCSAWPNSIEISKVYTCSNSRISGQPYMGPEFKDLDDELQNSLYDYLEERGIDDELATFLHKYMKNKDKTEYIKWMERVKSFIEMK